MRKFAAIIFLFCVLPMVAYALPDYSGKTGEPCSKCHIDPNGSGTLTDSGEYYGVNGMLPETDTAGGVINLGEYSRFLLGYVHLLVGVVWFGAIFYIHIFIGPRKLVKGIPKGERILGLVSMFLVFVTGILLTLNRIGRLSDFTRSDFGKILALKILFSFMMFCLAMLAVTFLHKKLSADTEHEIEKEADRKIADAESCSVMVKVDGTFYDLSSSKMWKGGQHMRRHIAGGDLSNAIKEAPHGKEVLARFPKISDPASEEIDRQQESAAFKTFSVFAYINLILVLLILSCIALWRWGLHWF